MSTNPASSPNIAPALSRTILLSVILLGGRVLDAATDQTAHARRPRNLVLISIDTLRQDALSCYGASRQTTPVIDALAQRGRRFPNMFSTSSLTPPSHMSIFTSQYPFEHGVGYDRENLRPGSAYTLADVLQQYGYQTGAFMGAWVSDPWFGPANGFANGFLTWDHPNVFWHPNTKIREWLQVRHQHPGEPFFLFLHGFDVHEPHLVAPGLDGRRFDPDYHGPVPGTWDELLKQSDPPVDWWTMIEARFPEISFKELVERFDHFDRLWRKHALPNAETFEHVRAVYDAQLYYADRGIGSILAWLSEFGFQDNTLIVVTSDHGQEFGEHGKWAEHRQLYDELLRVPLIIEGPGVSPGKPLTQLVSSIDIVPTVLALLGIPSPHTSRGTSLVPLLQNRSTAEVHDALYATVQGDVAVRTRAWKWIKHSDGRQELYHLSQDPKERENLIDHNLTMATTLASQFDEMLRVMHPAPGPGDAALRERLRTRGYW